MTEYLLGTSSWSEKAWVGTFYPLGTRPGDMLAVYSRRFLTVEADVTYYRVPSSSMVAAWAQKTPEDFRLSAKFPRSIVHGGQGAQPNPDVVLRPDLVGKDAREFLEAMAYLGPKCGPLVLQFPYFGRAAFPEVSPFLERLDLFLGNLPRTFRYAVEVRNRAWIGPPLLELLRAHAVALVWVDLAYLPHPASLARDQDLCTTDFLYCRLIGDRTKVDSKTSELNRTVIDQSRRLDMWASLLQREAPRVARVHVYANNHYAGYGPATVEELERLLGTTDPANAATSGGTTDPP